MIVRALLAPLCLTLLPACDAGQVELRQPYTSRQIAVSICDKRATPRTPMMEDRPFLSCMAEMGFPLS